MSSIAAFNYSDKLSSLLLLLLILLPENVVGR
jgi:hypothetical protein